MRRVILIVLDSVGIGQLPDAADYGDVGANTLLNVKKAVGLSLPLPNMDKLGLSQIDGICDRFSEYTGRPKAAYGRFAEASKGKDTTTGHWEIAGLISREAFPTYPGGFPAELVSEFGRRVGRGVLGNIPASGTEIIEKYGKEHMRTGELIVYTSADSVFQIAAHESIVPPVELYAICKLARELLTGEHSVSRVIARPFAGEPGSFVRTKNRRDYSLEPGRDTILDILKARGLPVIGIGKIEDIFAAKGLTHSIHTAGNMDGMDKLLEVMADSPEGGLVFVNLVDFDMLYGHRNDPDGYARALVEFDVRLPEVLGIMEDRDILIITADHGCDPTMPGTDHSREYVPALIYGRGVRADTNLGTRQSFADIGATAAHYLLGEPAVGVDGTSFLEDILG